MKAAVVTRFGPPSELKILEVPDPRPGDGEVLVRTRAIGLNFADLFARMGYYPSVPRPPFIPGIELTGVVERVGPGVKNLKKGDRVFAVTKFNAYAEFVCAPATHTMLVPKRMSFEEAAAFTVTYLSAYHGLVTLAGLQRGEKLLVHAAAGGVGTAAIQIARHRAAEIFATAGSAEKLEVARAQGAHHLVNYRTEDFAERVRATTRGSGVDVILDSVGGRIIRKGMGLLAPMGRYVLFGFAAVTGERRVKKLKALRELALTPMVFPQSLATRNISFMGFNLFFLMHKVDYLRQAMETLLKLYRDRALRPFVGATYRFDRIAEAQAFLQSRKSVGKVVILL
ncbi:MAG: zinc-binding dehydrogenase [Ignavibacteria bacterium]|nr:zinc-binding dehydrogenase [Ignavibacteria bacterium]